MREFLTTTVDARPLALCRILVGIASLPLAVEWFLPMRKAGSGDFLALPVFEWGPLVSTTYVIGLFVLALMGGLGMVSGMLGRMPSVIVASVSALVLLMDQQTYSNHLLLLTILSTFVAFSGSHEAWTVIKRRGSRNVPYWPAFLIKAQVSTLYFWTAVSKINEQYLSGEVIAVNLRSWVSWPESLFPAVALASIAAEFFLSFALWIPRFIPLAFIVGAGLHVGILAVLNNPAPLIPFACLMLAGYVLFGFQCVLSKRANPFVTGEPADHPS